MSRSEFSLWVPPRRKCTVPANVCNGVQSYACVVVEMVQSNIREQRRWWRLIRTSRRGVHSMPMGMARIQFDSTSFHIGTMTFHSSSRSIVKRTKDSLLRFYAEFAEFSCVNKSIKINEYVPLYDFVVWNGTPSAALESICLWSGLWMFEIFKRIFIHCLGAEENHFVRWKEMVRFIVFAAIFLVNVNFQFYLSNFNFRSYTSI